VVKVDTFLENLLHTGDKRKFYSSPSWRKIRKEVLKRDYYTCVRCKEKGKYKRANTVHHKKEIKDYPYLALTFDNLESLCHGCHDEIHGRDAANLIKCNPKYYHPERW
jgi:5-methylcytosine-specific restriction endonuclease McrA